MGVIILEMKAVSIFDTEVSVLLSATVKSQKCEFSLSLEKQILRYD